MPPAGSREAASSARRMSAAQSGAAALLGASKHAAVLLSSTEVPGSVATTVGVVGFAAWWLLSSGDKYLGRRNKK